MNRRRFLSGVGGAATAALVPATTPTTTPTGTTPSREQTGLGGASPGWLDVRAYGAVGDGTTDDTAAIQKAIDAATTLTFPTAPIAVGGVAGGAVVYLPVGRYKVTSTLAYKSGLKFRGVGWGSQILFSPAGHDALWEPSAQYAVQGTMYDVAWADLAMFAGSAFAQDCLRWTRMRQHVLDNVAVVGFSRYGVYLAAVADTYAYYNQIRNPYFVDNGTHLCIHNDGVHGANALQVYGGDFWQTPTFTTDYAIVLQGVSASFFGSAIEGHPTVALIHDAGAGSGFFGCYTETTNSTPVLLRDASKNLAGGVTLQGTSYTGTLVKYQNFDRAGAEGGWPTLPDNLGLGSPQPIPVISNGSFRKGAYNWRTVAHHATETVDTSTVFCAPASLKWVHDGTTAAHVVNQTLDLSSYQNRQVYFTMLTKFMGTDWPSIYLQIEGRNVQLHPVIDYGTGWQLWMTAVNVTAASAIFTISLSQANATTYLALAQAWIGGIPQVPTELNTHEVFTASAPPTTGSGWAPGDIVWNSAPTAGGTPGWVCTSAAGSGTWKAMANLAV